MTASSIEMTFSFEHLSSSGKVEAWNFACNSRVNFLVNNLLVAEYLLHTNILCILCMYNYIHHAIMS